MKQEIFIDICRADGHYSRIWTDPRQRYMPFESHEYIGLFQLPMFHVAE
jgi:hypothetical protein